ncbi:MAG: hypothetical protein KF819_19515 [Labilithrix sp.]|nr:hypothetical protein [Labilithrix sp.]
MNRSVLKSAALILTGLFAVFATHCAAPTDLPEEATGEEAAADDDEGDVQSTSQALHSNCWAQIQRPFPTDKFLAAGTAMKLRTNPNLNCPVNVTEKLAYRFYVEGPGGRISLQGADGWSLSRIVDLDTTSLQPGRYKVYLYSMPASMIPAWLQNDPVARHTSKRSGNTYFELVNASWSTGNWSACSASCDMGMRARSVDCKNVNGTVVDASFCAGLPPSTSELCYAGPCMCLPHCWAMPWMPDCMGCL